VDLARGMKVIKDRQGLEPFWSHSGELALVLHRLTKNFSINIANRSSEQ
jgi:hypothetical protein